MRISVYMTNGKFKNITLVFVAAAIAIACSMFIGLPAANANEPNTQANTNISNNNPANTINIEVAIVWSDNVEAHFGQSSSVTLYQNGAPISTVTLSSPLWWYQWTGLDSASSYDIRQNSYFEGYYTEYAWDAQNRMTIKNIQNGSPVPPWPTPTPGPAPEPETNIIIEYYEDGTPANGSNTNNQNSEAEASNNSNNAMIHSNPNNSGENSGFDFGPLFEGLTQILSKSWFLFLGLIGLIVLFVCEKKSARKNKND